MKKTLIALAVLATAGTAFAQSTVTLSGTFSAGYQSFESAAVTAKEPTAAQYSAQTSALAAHTAAPTVGTRATLDLANAAVAKATLAGAAASTSKGIAPATDTNIKATIVEDLGGGLKITAAGDFNLNGARGGNLTKGDSSVTLAGGFGSLAFVNTRSSNTAIQANVFASWMPVTAFYATVDARAAIDLLSYTSPEVMPGLKFGIARLEVTENTATSINTQTILSATYAVGPLSLAGAQKTMSGVITAGTEKSNTELAATYDFGPAKVGLGYGSALTTTGKNLNSYGISVPVGAMTFGINGAKRGALNFYDAGVNYALSKRTQVRAQLGKMEGGSNAGNQYRVGLFHTF